MNFRQRFLRYGIGVAIGLGLSVVIFSNREWLGWTPNAMVLKRLAATYIPSEKGDCWLECHKVSEEEVQKIIQEGEVDFGDSQVAKDQPSLYVLTLEGGDRQYTFRAKGDTATIHKIIDLRKDEAIQRHAKQCGCK